MPRGVWAIIGAGFLAAGLSAVGVAAQPPLPAKTGPKPEPARLADLSPDPAAERIRLQEQILSAIRQLKDRPGLAGPPKSAGPKLDLPPGVQPVDRIRAAINLFKANETEAALRALKELDVEAMGREDRATTLYLRACCLRKLNRRTDALTVFREVANAKDDAFLAECAVSQISLIRAAQDLEALLTQFRARPKTP